MIKKILTTTLVIAVCFLLYIILALLFTIKQNTNTIVYLNGIIIQQNNFIAKKVNGKWV